MLTTCTCSTLMPLQGIQKWQAQKNYDCRAFLHMTMYNFTINYEIRHTKETTRKRLYTVYSGESVREGERGENHVITMTKQNDTKWHAVNVVGPGLKSRRVGAGAGQVGWSWQRGKSLRQLAVGSRQITIIITIIMKTVAATRHNATKWQSRFQLSPSLRHCFRPVWESVCVCVASYAIVGPTVSTSQTTINAWLIAAWGGRGGWKSAGHKLHNEMKNVCQKAGGERSLLTWLS